MVTAGVNLLKPGQKVTILGADAGQQAGRRCRRHGGRQMKGGFNLSRWALEHIPLTRYLMAVLLIGGMLSYASLGQDEDPPFTFRAMVLQAYWPGATAVQMAEQVTDKLEKKLQETPYIDEITSYSKPGETLILLELRESAPPKETAAAWYQVRKKIGDIQGTLPSGVRGPVLQ